MHRAAPNLFPLHLDLPTVWGLNPVELHDRYWASRSVCVVRPGSGAPLPRSAELFLLTDARTLALFPLRGLVEQIFWARPSVVFVRLQYKRDEQYRESVVRAEDGRFLRFARHYGTTHRQVARIALTADSSVARLWQATDGSPTMWREFRRQMRKRRRRAHLAQGEFYDRFNEPDVDRLVSDLIRLWRRPSATIDGIREVRPGVWGVQGVQLDSTTRFLGPAWIGAGRHIGPELTVLGPAALWDEVERRPAFREMRWEQLDPNDVPETAPVAPGPANQWRRRGKRAFDIVFASAALLLTLPLYPLIMLAIWLEDGRPFIFAQRRETLGGREFNCLKFRSMRKDADQFKVELLAKNQSDGPQFFIEHDPRVTRTGRFLRRTNLDELPQFLNVLLGEMSVVGPRPSPRAENQCCPAWREARLSVRPGITGLWQVSRTRGEGLDFQEWIKFDVEYVERASWWLDLLVIARTLRFLLGR